MTEIVGDPEWARVSFRVRSGISGVEHVSCALGIASATISEKRPSHNWVHDAGIDSAEPIESQLLTIKRFLTSHVDSLATLGARYPMDVLISWAPEESPRDCLFDAELVSLLSKIDADILMSTLLDGDRAQGSTSAVLVVAETHQERASAWESLRRSQAHWSADVMTWRLHIADGAGGSFDDMTQRLTDGIRRSKTSLVSLTDRATIQLQANWRTRLPNDGQEFSSLVLHELAAIGASLLVRVEHTPAQPWTTHDWHTDMKSEETSGSRVHKPHSPDCSIPNPR